jgi:glycosyltransferase involved in cell wall biosynthesis
MPTYNRAGLIAETVNSIRNQTFSDWELLIMDDGSDDNTEAIIGEYQDERIHFFKAERTGRVSRLKNMGIEISRGGLIAFIDSDDLWDSTKLEKQLIALEKFPEAGFCITGGFTFVLNNAPVQYLYKQREGVRVDDFLLPMFRSEISGFTQVLLYRKECVRVSGYFDEKKLFSDPDFIIGLASHYKGVLLYEPLFFRRLHKMSDSDQHWEKRYLEWADVIQCYYAQRRIPASESHSALFKLYINFGEKCLKKKIFGKAMLNFGRAWTKKPFSVVPLKKTAKAVLLSFGVKRTYIKL